MRTTPSVLENAFIREDIFVYGDIDAANNFFRAPASSPRPAAGCTRLAVK
jgi:hypothetical protein